VSSSATSTALEALRACTSHIRRKAAREAYEATLAETLKASLDAGTDTYDGLLAVLAKTAEEYREMSAREAPVRKKLRDAAAASKQTLQAALDTCGVSAVKVRSDLYVKRKTARVTARHPVPSVVSAAIVDALASEDQVRHRARTVLDQAAIDADAARKKLVQGSKPKGRRAADGGLSAPRPVDESPAGTPGLDLPAPLKSGWRLGGKRRRVGDDAAAKVTAVQGGARPRKMLSAAAAFNLPVDRHPTAREVMGKMVFGAVYDVCRPAVPTVQVDQKPAAGAVDLSSLTEPELGPQIQDAAQELYNSTRETRTRLKAAQTRSSQDTAVQNVVRKLLLPYVQEHADSSTGVLQWRAPFAGYSRLLEFRVDDYTAVPEPNLAMLVEAVKAAVESCLPDDAPVLDLDKFVQDAVAGDWPRAIAQSTAWHMDAAIKRKASTSRVVAMNRYRKKYGDDETMAGPEEYEDVDPRFHEGSWDAPGDEGSEHSGGEDDSFADG
jgi:hypothetical protein